jgi:hypothetical protein
MYWAYDGIILKIEEYEVGKRGFYICRYIGENMISQRVGGV